eukprot:EG_transcript_10576
MFHADALKENGNKLFQEGRFKEAVDAYSEALRLRGEDATLLCNRSAAHLGDGDPKAALLDAYGATDLKPRWSKAHFRLAKALAQLNRHADAYEAMQKAHSLAPMDDAIRKALAEMQPPEKVQPNATAVNPQPCPPKPHSEPRESQPATRESLPPAAAPPNPPGGGTPGAGRGLCPNAGPSLQPVFMEVSWNDGDHLVTLNLPLPHDTRAKDLEVKVTARAIAVSDRRVGRQYLAKEFSHEVDPSEDSVDWFIDHDTVPGQSILRVTLQKTEQFKRWETLFVGDAFRKGYSTFSEEHKYDWRQTDEEVFVQFPLPAGCDHRTLAVEFRPQHLRVRWPGHPPLMDRPLLFPIKVSESLWSVCSGRLEITLTKREKCKVWCSVIVDGPDVDPQSALVEMIHDPDAEKCSYADLGPQGQEAVDAMRRYEAAKAQNDAAAIARAEFELQQMSFCLTLR